MEEKSVLISIRPEWCKKIADGEKTIEVRKTRPKMDPPFRGYIYCTKPNIAHRTVCGSMSLNDDQLYRHPKEGIKYGDSIELMLCDDYTADNFLNGKVIGEFICDKIITVDCDSVAPFDHQTKQYIDKETCLNRKTLWQYTGGYQAYGWHITDLVIYDVPKKLGDFRKPCTSSCKYIGECGESPDPYCLFEMERAPQSWCYCYHVKKEN